MEEPFPPVKPVYYGKVFCFSPRTFIFVPLWITIVTYPQDGLSLKTWSLPGVRWWWWWWSSQCEPGFDGDTLFRLVFASLPSIKTPSVVKHKKFIPALERTLSYRSYHHNHYQVYHWSVIAFTGFNKPPEFQGRIYVVPQVDTYFDIKLVNTDCHR